MATTPNSYRSTDALAEKIGNIENIVVELKAMIQGIDARVRAVEQNEIGCRAVNDQKLDAAHRRLDEHESRLEKLEGRMIERFEKLEKYLPIIQLLAWALPIIGAMILALLWSIFTHGAMIP